MQHRKNAFSIDSTPRQTIMKALNSRAPPTIHSALSVKSDNDQSRRESATARRLSQALSDLQLDGNTMATAKLAALASPCFFHKRFDDAVNFEKVLEEIQDDEGMSHSRLMQTAHGVREVSRQLQRRPIKRAVRSVLIVTKARDNELVLLTRELAEWLLTTPRYGSDVGVNVYVDAKLRRSKRFDAASLTSRDPRFETMLRYWTPDLCWTSPEKFDLVLTLGGDGTVLFTSWLFQRIVPPILSFSLGSLGFLTNFSYQEFRHSLTNIMGDMGMRVNLRMRFTCTVYRANRLASIPGSNEAQPESIEGEQFEVLNELVIDRGPSPYVSNLELYGDGNLLTIIQADGCIFSTPTGSTAYSLSAGGSLVHPDIPALLLTPICPHTLSFRPMLLNDTMSLRIAVPKGSRGGAWCSFDGKNRVELRPGDAVTIAASQYPFPTVLSNSMEWFDSISRTLRWNTRGATQKAWSGSADGDAETEGAGAAKPEEFDIDFDEPEDRDSGYSAESSTTGGASPVRKGTMTGL
ncbi:NAD kinase associated with ferric reductase [Rhizodiscina lignyota]|uniref:NAD kinase associated with ferric reductase n=1 Tax=Rhizodiscina lignyota TaxID=1504668 RepID=A0A9P4IMY4_9PEZI|nr:NAD kinase associated with ferric reductase [Rhizodiscina lignyota]